MTVDDAWESFEFWSAALQRDRRYGLLRANILDGLLSAAKRLQEHSTGHREMQVGERRLYEKLSR